MAANERQFPDYAVAAGIVFTALITTTNTPGSIAYVAGQASRTKSNVTSPNGIVIKLNGGVTNQNIIAAKLKESVTNRQRISRGRCGNAIKLLSLAITTKNHVAKIPGGAGNIPVDCGDTSLLWNNATGRVVEKRGHVRALQSHCANLPIHPKLSLRQQNMYYELLK
jgi:hypothetical protein